MAHFHYLRRISIGVSLLLLSATYGKAQTTILNEDFEAGTPAEWTQQTSATDGGWLNGDATTLSSQYFSIPDHTTIMATNDDDCNCDKSNELLITDTVDLSGYSSVIMSFDRYFLEGSYNSTEEMTIEVSTDSGSTWSTEKTLSGESEWINETVDLSSYIGNSGVLIAFRYHDKGDWLYGAAIDNVHIYEPLDRDLEMTELDIDKYVVTPTTVTIAGTVTNLGGNTINSFDLKWQADGGTVHTENVTGLNITTLGTHSFTHTDNLNMNNAVTKDLTVWIEGPNGSADQDNNNDSLSQKVAGLSEEPTKHVLVEQATGAWCQFCPDGQVKLHEAMQNNPNTHGIALHYNDPMEFNDALTVQGEYISGYPRGLVDRYMFEAVGEVQVQRTNWETLAGERLQHTVPGEVSLNVDYDQNSREITVDVTADFYGEVNDEVRLNAFVIEDHVSDSTDSDYHQVNYYDDQSGHPYSGAGDPIVGYDHRHVARAFLGGPWGSSGSITAPINDGDSYTESYTYTLPSDYKEHDVSIIGVLQKYSADPEDRAIWNIATDSSMMEMFASVNDASKEPNSSISVHPNPVTDRAKVDIRSERAFEGRLEVRDMTGRLVKEEDPVRIGKGASYYPIDMSDEESGVYMIRLITDRGSITERFSVVGR